MHRRVVATLNSEHPKLKFRLGGTKLVSINDEEHTFTVITGPTPWGAGSWGPFPAEAIISERPGNETDSWEVSGCPSQRWTLADLARAEQAARR